MRYADDLPYWKTSQSSPDVWMERTVNLIFNYGGIIISQLAGTISGKTGYMIIFRVGEDTFRISWPVSQSKKDETRAAKVQAATMMHHDIKAKLITAEVFGTRAAFFSYLLLPDGRTASEASVPELQNEIPSLFLVNQLTDVVDGEYIEE